MLQLDLAWISATLTVHSLNSIMKIFKAEPLKPIMPNSNFQIVKPLKQQLP
jgi:hypothetical protein